MWVVVFIIIVVFLFVISKSGPVENKIKIEITAPNPERCQDKTMIDFINKTENYKLEPLFKEYVKNKLILKPIYIEAFNQKINKGFLDLSYFYSKAGIYINPILDDEKEINEPISLKKWADEYQEEKKESNFTIEDFVRFKDNKIESEFLKPKMDIEDKTNYFFEKKVVITGTFEKFPYRNELAHLLWSVGADVDTIVNKKTDVVILGNQAGWKKMELIEKYQPQVIDQEILMGYFPNYKPKFT